MQAIDEAAGDGEAETPRVGRRWRRPLHRRSNGKVIPGFGHRFHGVDPRSVRLLELVREAAAAGVVERPLRADRRGHRAPLQQRKGDSRSR